MKILRFAFIALLSVSFCHAQKTAENAVAESSVSAIAWGNENFVVAVPANGAVTVLTHAPRTIASDLTQVKVNITAASNSAIKIGNKTFKNGDKADFTSLVTFTVTAQDGTVKSYGVDIAPYDTVANPYGIYTAKHLADMANALTASFLLKNDIDLPNADAAGAAKATGIKDYAAAGWKPLGPFTGTFDGGNFSINNFYAKRKTARVGLFGELGTGGVIKNLGVNGAGGTAVAGTNSKPYQYTGILAGLSSGTIDKCHAAGNVSSSSFSPSSAGGLVGSNRGVISNSHAAGNVSSPSSSAAAGGLAGYNDGPISHSYAVGNVSAAATARSHVGGLVGDNHGRISHSHATGNVSAEAAASCAGGLLGVSTSSISNSYATGNVFAASYNKNNTRYAIVAAGGLVGISSDNISHSYATGDVSSSSSSSSSFAGGLVGTSRDSISHSYATGSVSCSFSSSVPASEQYGYRTHAGGLAGTSHGSISNSYAAGGVSSSSSSVAHAGGLVGDNYEKSSISNSYATGGISASSSSDTHSHAGGLAGFNGGSISNSYATGDVSASSFAGSYAYSGGFSGFNGGNISNSYAAGDVSASSSAAAYAGGFSGYEYKATYANCCRNSEATIKKNDQVASPKDADIADIAAKTKAEMQTDAFKGNLNGASGTAWGRSDSKNDKLPYIIGVGVGK